MNQLERVARAICATHGRDPDFEIYGLKDWEVWKDHAQAAIDAMDQWQPIETAPLETEIYVWAEYYDKPILTKAFISSADNKTVLFQGLAREQHPSVWSPIPDPPK